MVHNFKSKEIYLLRHGDTGLGGRYIGSTDVPLADGGKAQLRNTANFLQTVNLDSILMSPMKRCIDSVEILSLTTVAEQVDKLKEIDFGSWEGKSFSEILEKEPDLINQWAKKPEAFVFPGGEGIQIFRERVSSFADQLYKMKKQSILIVSHGGVIRNLLCLLLNLEPENYLLFDVQPGLCSTVRLYPEGGILTGFNLGGR